MQKFPLLCLKEFSNVQIYECQKFINIVWKASHNECLIHHNEVLKQFQQCRSKNPTPGTTSLSSSHQFKIWECLTIQLRKCKQEISGQCFFSSKGVTEFLNDHIFLLAEIELFNFDW